VEDLNKKMFMKENHGKPVRFMIILIAGLSIEGRKK
jgi:hypothetical protein